MTRKGKPQFDPDTLLAILSEGHTVAENGRNQVLFAQGDPADAVFYVRKGKVKLTVVSQAGKEAVVAILGAGDFLGESCLTGQPLRLATATTMTECTIARLQKSAMMRLLHSDPGFSEMFISYLLSRNMRIEEDLVDQLLHEQVSKAGIYSLQRPSGSAQLASECGAARLRPRRRKRLAEAPAPL